MRATLPQTTAANDALENVRAGIWPGLSVEFMPEKYRFEGKDREIVVVEKAELRGIAIVDRPAYANSKINRYEETRMTEQERAQELERRIDEALAKRTGDSLTREDVAQIVKDTTTAVMADAEQARAQQEQAEAKAAADKLAATETAATERAAIMEAADTRVRFAALLPKLTSTRRTSPPRTSWWPPSVRKSRSPPSRTPAT